MNPFVTSGDAAPYNVFYNGPASNAYNTGRFNFYGVTGTPTVKIDGMAVSSSPGTFAGSINTRLAVPSHCAITANPVGNASGGTVYVSVTAEQALAASLKLYVTINEDHDIAGSGYGLYSGMEMMWESRAWPAGPTGTVINFTGPYPQTLNFMFPYTLVPSTMTFSNLNLIAYVQTTAGTREVQNALYMDMPDTATGVYEDGTAPGIDVADLNIGPNPTSGTLNIYSLLPTGTSGNVSIFDLNGRIVDEFSAGGAVTTTIDTPGVYFVRMETSSGEILTRSCTVLR